MPFPVIAAAAARAVAPAVAKSAATSPMKTAMTRAAMTQAATPPPEQRNLNQVQFGGQPVSTGY